MENYVLVQGVAVSMGSQMTVKGWGKLNDNKEKQIQEAVYSDQCWTAEISEQKGTP
jgi:hypothetical protein